MAPNTTETTSQKASNTPAEYPSLDVNMKIKTMNVNSVSTINNGHENNYENSTKQGVYTSFS